LKKRSTDIFDGLVKSRILVILNGVKDLQLFDVVRFFAEFILSEAEGLRMTGFPLVHFLRDHHICTFSLVDLTVAGTAIRAIWPSNRPSHPLGVLLLNPMAISNSLLVSGARNQLSAYP
jgi:hypothetical protein